MAIKVGGSQAGGMDEINVTPLIDVVLVLLIIFMVLTPITVQKMANNLPPPPEETPPPPDDTPPDQLMVAVYADGTISLNLKEGPDADIMKELAQRLRSKAKKTVFLDADPKANYGRVVAVMDMIRGASMTHDSEKGIDVTDVHVGLAEMKEEGPARLLPGTALPGAPTPVPGAPAVP
jgi:biopolymer transport protein ExbD